VKYVLPQNASKTQNVFDGRAPLIYARSAYSGSIMCPQLDLGRNNEEGRGDRKRL